MEDAVEEKIKKATEVGVLLMLMGLAVGNMKHENLAHMERSCGGRKEFLEDGYVEGAVNQLESLRKLISRALRTLKKLEGK